jgi:phage terminase Nu1 subunit (DNA packaging protein)
LPTLTATELCDQLSIDRKQLAQWVKDGLPWHGSKRRKTFDAHEVSLWLVQSGKAEPDPAAPREQFVLRTIGQVATHFDVSEKTVQNWLRNGMPGTPGPRGRQQGYFSVHQISEWLKAQREPPSTASDDSRALQHARLHKARAELIELEVAKKKGELVEAEEIARQIVRSIHEAKAQLGQLTVKLTRGLPEKYRTKQRAIIQRTLTEVYRTLELALRRQADEELLSAEQSAERTKDEGQPEEV